jgi:hypothetical protein
MTLSTISLFKPVLTRALSISFFAACAVLSGAGQESEAWPAVGTQDVVLEEEIEEQEKRVRQAFEMEKGDPEWSQRAESSWTQVFQQELIKEELKGIQVRSIECRTTLCRVELTTTDHVHGGAVFEADVGKLLLFAPWQGSGFGRIVNPDGQAPVALIYMAREGYTLPPFPNRLGIDR